MDNWARLPSEVDATEERKCLINGHFWLLQLLDLEARDAKDSDLVMGDCERQCLNCGVYEKLEW